MEKEFIPYEQALALKELGFDEPCLQAYDKNGILYYSHRTDKLFTFLNSNLSTQCSAPLYQQAFRWFRKKYKLQAEIIWRSDMKCFCYKTGKFKYGSHDFSKDDYKTYEEAELECLKKLIEIVKL